MSEQTRQLAERIARDLFTGYHVNGWTEAGLMIRIEKHLRHAAGASVPQEAAVTRARLIAEYLQEYDRCVAGLTSLTAREYFEGALDFEILNRQANRPVSHD